MPLLRRAMRRADIVEPSMTLREMSSYLLVCSYACSRNSKNSQLLPLEASWMAQASLRR